MYRPLRRCERHLYTHIFVQHHVTHALGSSSLQHLMIIKHVAFNLTCTFLCYDAFSEAPKVKPDFTKFTHDVSEISVTL